MVKTIQRSAFVGKNTLENNITSLVGDREHNYLQSTTISTSTNTASENEKGGRETSETNSEYEDYVCEMIDGLTLKWTKRREDREWNRVPATDRSSDALSNLKQKQDERRGQTAQKLSKHKDAKKSASNDTCESGKETMSMSALPALHQTRLIVPGWHRALRNMVIASQKELSQASPLHSTSSTPRSQVSGSDSADIKSYTPRSTAASPTLALSLAPSARSLLLDPRKLVVYDFD